MKPEEALAMAARMAMREIDAGGADPRMFEEFLRQTIEQGRATLEALSRVPGLPADLAAEVDEVMYVEALKFAVGALLALANFANLERVQYDAAEGEVIC